MSRDVARGTSILHPAALDDAPKAYAPFNEKEDGCVKVVLKL